MIAQVDGAVLRHQIRGGLDVGIRELVSVAQQRRQLTDDAIDFVEVGRVALHEQLVAMRPDADVEERFEMFEVLVVGTKQRFNPLSGDGDALH